MSIPPDRLLADRMAALDVANDIRRRRAEVHQGLKEGRIDPVAILEDPPEFMLGMKFARFLRWIPKIGPVKADEFLDNLGVSRRTTLYGLGTSKRRRAASRLAAMSVIRRPEAGRERS